MQVYFKRNAVQSTSTKQSTNILEQIKNSAVAKIESYQEDRALEKQLFSENLEKNITSLTSSRLTGEVNGKQVVINEKLEKKTASLDGHSSYKGQIGSNNVDLKVFRNLGGTKIEGYVGNKEVKLNLPTSLTPVLSGSIDNKEISIKIGDALENTKGENDILTTTLALIGKRFTVMNGKFGIFEMSYQKELDFKKQEQYMYETAVLMS